MKLYDAHEALEVFFLASYVSRTRTKLSQVHVTSVANIRCAQWRSRLTMIYFDRFGCTIFSRVLCVHAGVGCESQTDSQQERQPLQASEQVLQYVQPGRGGFMWE